MSRKRRYSWLLGFTFVCLLPAQTQRTMGTSRTTTPDNPGDADTSVLSNRGGPFSNQGSSSGIADFQRPLIVSGKVLLDDGTPPPDPVKIERVCGGQAVPEGFTDGKGRFTIELGADPSATMTDASVPTAADGNIGGGFIEDPFGGVGTTSGGLGRVNPLGCELRAELAGYESDAVSLGRRTTMSHPDVGTIVLRRKGDVQGTAISVTSLEAPKKARKMYESARKEALKKEPDFKKAMAQLEETVAIYPDFAAAWHFLGELRLNDNDVEKGREAFEKAIAADESYLNPYDPLMRIALGQGRWEEAERLSQTALRLNPAFPEAQYCLAVSSYKQGKLEPAREAALALQSTPRAAEFPESLQLLGTLLGKAGMFQQAAHFFQQYLAARPDSPAAGEIERYLVEWEALGVIKPPANTTAQPQ